MFLWISSSSCPLNLLLVRSHQAEIIVVKLLFQGRNNITRVKVEPRSYNQGCRKNDAFRAADTSMVDSYHTTKKSYLLVSRLVRTLVTGMGGTNIEYGFVGNECDVKNDLSLNYSLVSVVEHRVNN